MKIYENAWKDIVQPLQIKAKKHMLGPTERDINGLTILRKDLLVSNRNNKIISGFLFYCPQQPAEHTILYLHGNGGSKL